MKRKEFLGSLSVLGIGLVCPKKGDEKISFKGPFNMVRCPYCNEYIHSDLRVIPDRDEGDIIISTVGICKCRDPWFAFAYGWRVKPNVWKQCIDAVGRGKRFQLVEIPFKEEIQ